MSPLSWVSELFEVIFFFTFQCINNFQNFKLRSTGLLTALKNDLKANSCFRNLGLKSKSLQNKQKLSYKIFANPAKKIILLLKTPVCALCQTEPGICAGVR
jgi:hypothetical protein